MNHSAQTENIDVEHPPHLFVFALFNRREIADARIIHEHVDAAERQVCGRPSRVIDEHHAVINATRDALAASRHRR